MCSGCTEEARVNEPDAKEQIYCSLGHFEKLEGPVPVGHTIYPG